MKKIISLTLTLLLVMGALFVFPANATSKIITSGDWQYKILDDGNLRLWGYTGSKTDLTVPDYIDGHKVTRILFFGNKKIKTVRLGKYIEKIYTMGISAHTGLEKVVVSKNNPKYSSKKGLLLNKKGNMLVAYPGGIKGDNIKLPKTITYIGRDACAGNKIIKKLVIPQNVKRIGNAAFYNCDNLTYVKLPKTVKIIDDGAFDWNRKLEKIEFDSSQTYKLGYNIFRYCNRLKTVVIPKINNKKDPYAGGGLFTDCGRIRKAIIPNGVRFIPGYCFENCYRLKSITVPSSVKKIGDIAFGYKWDDDYHKYVPNPDFTVKGKKGSAAEKYAKANKLKFKAI